MYCWYDVSYYICSPDKKDVIATINILKKNQNKTNETSERGCKVNILVPFRPSPRRESVNRSRCRSSDADEELSTDEELFCVYDASGVQLGFI